MCIFCDIANHKIDGHKKEDGLVFEDELVAAFKDNNPKAPVHLLVVPKKHIESINHLQDGDKEIVSRMIFTAKQMAVEHKIAETGYRLGFNVGRGGGQVIDHLHLHLMGGN